jgi:hypothetical protein
MVELIHDVTRVMAEPGSEKHDVPTEDRDKERISESLKNPVLETRNVVVESDKGL